jgi:hypothetical protein
MREFGDHLAAEIFAHRFVDFWRRQTKDMSCDELLEARLICNLVVVLLDKVCPLDWLDRIDLTIQDACQRVMQGAPRNQYLFYSRIFRQHALELIEQPFACG